MSCLLVAPQGLTAALTWSGEYVGQVWMVWVVVGARVIQGSFMAGAWLVQGYRTEGSLEDEHLATKMRHRQR